MAADPERLADLEARVDRLEANQPPARTPPELSRRGVLFAGTLSLAGLSMLSGGAEPVFAQQDDREFQGAAVLMGPDDGQSPALQPDAAFFENKTRYTYLYYGTSVGGRYLLQTDDRAWTTLSLSAGGHLGVPVYDDVRNVDPTIDGSIVILTGSVQEPAGFWWFNGSRWFAGDRTRVSAQQESVGGNSTVTLQEFVLPADTEIDVWQLQVTNLDGADDGLIIEVENVTDSTTIADYDGSNQSGVVKIGDPIATGGSGGDTIAVRARNTTGGSADITGFAVLSIQSTLT